MQTKLTIQEKKILISLIEKVTGNSHTEIENSHIFISKFEDILRTKKISFEKYLALVNSSAEEYNEFLSIITVHTTQWFREKVHFDHMAATIVNELSQGQRHFKIWSAACSTGQEVYTIALVLEKIKCQHSGMTYDIYGSDIDPISLEKAQKALYHLNELKNIPSEYHHFIFKSENIETPYFTLDEDILKNCHFFVNNLNDLSRKVTDKYDFVFCRNVFIYLKKSFIDEIISQLHEKMSSKSVLYLSVCEKISSKNHYFEHEGQSIYQYKVNLKTEFDKKKVLIVDDSPSIRIQLRTILIKNNFTIFEADCISEAEKVLDKQAIDLISLDIDLPDKNGLVWLKEIRARGYETPVVILSGTSFSEIKNVYGALEYGAQEYIEKTNLSRNFQYYIDVVQALTKNYIDDFKAKNLFITKEKGSVFEKDFRPDLIAIGASTGGPEALWELLNQVETPCPPIIIVQHTNHFFAKYLAETLHKISGLEVLGSNSGVRLEENKIYLAHGDYHLKVVRQSNALILVHDHSEPVHRHRPSVDILFESIAANNDLSVFSILLTGMGSDGAFGMKKIFENNHCYNMVQSEESCVVFGMPHEALKLNCVNDIGDISQIKQKIHQFIKNKKKFKKQAS